MFFKNARLFQLTAPFEYSQDDLETMLSEQVFVPCSKYEKSRLGWVAPLEEPPGEDVAPMLTHVIGDYVMVCAQKQDRLLPASVVREVTDEKVAELEQRQARKVFRKERRQIQDDVYASLLPQAFTRSQLTYAYISVKDRLLVIDASSAPRAEEVVNLLRDSLESFPVALPNSKRAPADVMTRWLKDGKAGGRFALHEDVELHNPLDSNNVVRCKGQDLTSEEVTAHLDAGKAVKSLGVLWGELLSCVIGDDLGIKRLRFETVDEETSDEVTPAQKFDQEMALMTLELSGFFSGLFEAFGGLDDPKPLPRKDEE
jgi:recombination associated protein RdgC